MVWRFWGRAEQKNFYFRFFLIFSNNGLRRDLWCKNFRGESPISGFFGFQSAVGRAWEKIHNFFLTGWIFLIFSGICTFEVALLAHPWIRFLYNFFRWENRIFKFQQYKKKAENNLWGERHISRDSPESLLHNWWKKWIQKGGSFWTPSASARATPNSSFSNHQEFFYLLRNWFKTT